MPVTTLQIKDGQLVKKVDGVLQYSKSADVLMTIDGTVGLQTPVINSFTLSPTTIQSGQATTLAWSVANATTVTISNGIGAVGASGSQVLAPTTNQTYVLTATNSLGSVTQTVNLVVNTAAGSVIPGDIVDTNGVVDQTAYNTRAYSYADDSGITYRFGPPASVTGIAARPERADVGEINYGGSRIKYQFGAEDTNAFNDFVTSNGAAVWVPSAGSGVASAVGRYVAYQIDRRTITQRPQLMWQSPQLLPPQVQDYLAANKLINGTPADLPIWEYRRVGAPDSGGTRMSLIGTQGSPTRGSVMFTVGTETAQNRATVQFPVGLVPTCCSVTPGGEFALLGMWDTINFKARMGVVALGGTPAGVDWTNPAGFYDWWHDWLDMVHPGFKNQGCWTFMKYLGSIELPDMKAPTCIDAVTGQNPTEAIYEPDPNIPGQQRISGLGKVASPMADNRARLSAGGDLNKWFSKGGAVAIGSKSEKKIAIVDIGPLFRYFNSMYLDSAASNLETQNVGLEANKWPYLMADRPQMTPTIVKTITMPGPVAGITSTCSWNYWSKDNQRRNPGTPYFMADPRYFRWRFYTTNGTCLIYSAGRYVPGPFPADQTPVPSEVAQVGSISGLGSQIVHVAPCKSYKVPHTTVYDPNDAPPGALEEMDRIVVRNERATKWIRFTEITGDGGSVIKTLTDSSWDPIGSDDVDGYYMSNYVITTADYSNGRIINHRHDNFVYNGTPSTLLDAAGERGGTLAVAGKPFHVHTSNAP